VVQDQVQQRQRAPSLAAAISLLAAGEGALAVAELQALRTTSPHLLGPGEDHYWLGLAYLLAFDWSAAIHELRAYLAREASGWRAGWAYLHLGRAYEQSGLVDEASLAYRGCLGCAGSERAARRLAFDLMSRLASSLPMGYGQASTRSPEGRP
jgi:tetratricopeptide (TPR) repeat protein